MRDGELSAGNDWDFKKGGVIAGGCLLGIIAVTLVIHTINDYRFHKNNVPDVRSPNRSISYDYSYYGRQQSLPLIRSNMIFFSFNIANLSISINKLIEDENLNIPPVRFYDSSLSFKDSTGWVVITKDATLLFIYDDISNKLTSEEVRALALHELGHVVLGHPRMQRPGFLRDVNMEKEADSLALVWGADPAYLISAIAKLSWDEEEAKYRLESIVQ